MRIFLTKHEFRRLKIQVLLNFLFFFYRSLQYSTYFYTISLNNTNVIYELN